VCQIALGHLGPKPDLGRGSHFLLPPFHISHQLNTQTFSHLSQPNLSINLGSSCSYPLRFVYRSSIIFRRGLWTAFLNIVNRVGSMAHHLWKAVGFCKPTVQSFISISRVFYSSRPVDESTSEILKKKLKNDKPSEFRQMKRLTDAEWTLQARKRDHHYSTKHKASWTEDHARYVLQRNAEVRRTKRAEDAEFRFKEWLSGVVRRHVWIRERLPWKTHTPVLYQDKVRHTCSTCLVPRLNGAYKLWWASHDGKHYQCGPCYLNGPNVMPKGYENVSSMKEFKSRRDELGH